MKANRGYRRRIVSNRFCMAVLAVALAAPPSVMASWRSWVGDDNSLGGSGTWNNVNTNWSGADAGTPPYYVWVTGDQPKFSGTGGVVTVEGTVTLLNRLYFMVPGYVLTGGLVRATGGLGISVVNGGTATVYSALSGRYQETPPAWYGISIRSDVGEGTFVLNSDLTQYEFNSDIIPYSGTFIMNGDNYSQGNVRQTDTGQFGVFILNGTHYYPAGYTFREDGTLGGTGTVQFADSGKAVNMYGTLTPGTATTIGTLTIAVGDLKLYSTARANFQVDLTANVADKVVVGDLLTYAGTLNVQVTGTRDSDASYTLFQFGSKTGTFTTNNITGVDFNKAEVSFDETTGILTYHPLSPKGTVVVIL